MFNQKMLLAASSLLLALASTAEAMPRHLPSIYGNTNPSSASPPSAYFKGWRMNVYYDFSTTHQLYASKIPLCFAYININSTHEYGVVYGASNWAGRWTQEGDQVRLQMQTTQWPRGGVIVQDAMQLELVTQAGSEKAEYHQMAFGHFDRWYSNPVIFGSSRTVLNATLEEMSPVDSEEFCKPGSIKLPTERLSEQDYASLVSQLPPIDISTPPVEPVEQPAVVIQ